MPKIHGGLSDPQDQKFAKPTEEVPVAQPWQGNLLRMVIATSSRASAVCQHSTPSHSELLKKV